MKTKELLTELLSAVTRDEAGRHFTTWLNWQPLEDLGLIEIYRPVHEQTGIPYSLEYWQIEHTPDSLRIAQLDDPDTQEQALQEIIDEAVVTTETKD